jgi:ribosomal protein S18 acetylase RimI-like enzyme
MDFREIEVRDIPALFRVRRATWHTDNAEQEMTALGITEDAVRKVMLSGSHKGWLCEVAGQVVGFAMGGRTNGEMWVIAVLKEHEGKGIGKKLLKLVEDWLWSEGWDEIWLTTDPDEEVRAVGFYRRLGWTDWKFDERDNRYMRKTRPGAAASPRV